MDSDYKINNAICKSIQSLEYINSKNNNFYYYQYDVWAQG